MTTEELNNLYAEIMKSRMGVNPYVSLGANVGGNLISALVANQARRRAQERLSGLQRPSMPQFRQNPLLAQRIAQQQQLADQPMMGYQRAADEQAGRQMERGRQIAAGLGGGAGLAYMQGVSSDIAAQQRQGLLTDMAMQARNRSELDQLINMRNQELQQQRSLDAMNYQLGFQDYVRQREGLQADIAQQQGNIGAAVGATVADIPQYVQNFRMYNALRDATPRSTEPITPMTPIGVKQVPSVPQKTYYSELNDPMARYRLGLNPLNRPPKQNYSPNLITDYYNNLVRKTTTGATKEELNPEKSSFQVDPSINQYLPYMQQTQSPVLNQTQSSSFRVPLYGPNIMTNPVSSQATGFIEEPQFIEEPLDQRLRNIELESITPMPTRSALQISPYEDLTLTSMNNPYTQFSNGLRERMQNFLSQRRLNRDYRNAIRELESVDQIKWFGNPPRPFLRDPKSGSLTLLRNR